MSSTILNTGFQHFMQAFAWMLAHSIWQGIALAISCGIVLMVFKRASSAARYNLILAHALLFVLACIITLTLELTSIPARSAVFSTLQSNLVNQFLQSTINYISGNAPMILLVWFIVFLFRSVHLFGGMAYVYQARRKQLLDAGDYWNTRITELGEQVGLKRIAQLFESGYVRVPMIIGHLKPVILIPAGLLTGLPAEQVEAVLLHELAHIKRNDFLVNLLQVALEAVFFFNPGFHYLSALLREEREHCCDDIALSHSNNKKGFVQALISFKEHALYGSNYAVAFPGKKNMLLIRIGHILGNPERKTTPLDRTFFATGILFLAMMMVLLGAKSNEEYVNASAKPAPVKHVSAISFDNSLKINSLTVNTKGKDKPKQEVRLADPEKEEAVENELVAYEDPKYPVYDDLQYSAALTKQDREAFLVHSKEMERHNQIMTQAKLEIEQSKRDQARALLDLEQAKKDLQQAAEDQKRAMADQQRFNIEQKIFKKQQEAFKRSNNNIYKGQ